MKKAIILVCLALVSWGANAQCHGSHSHSSSHDSHDKKAQTVEPVFKDKKLESVYKDYLKLKNALVDSDAENAKKASARLVNSLEELKSRPNEKARAEARKINAAPTLEKQREVLNSLSNEIAFLVKGGQINKGQMYLQYCPMANNDTGGYWLSNEKEIKNPYFGSSMLKCGTVKETIN
jgi:hypothetical protein